MQKFIKIEPEQIVISIPTFTGYRTLFFNGAAMVFASGSLAYTAITNVAPIIDVGVALAVLGMALINIMCRVLRRDFAAPEILNDKIAEPSAQPAPFVTTVSAQQPSETIGSSGPATHFKVSKVDGLRNLQDSSPLEFANCRTG